MSARGWAVAMFGALALGACRSPEAPATQSSATPPASVQAPSGAPATLRFAGTLPCADCAGIRTELALRQDTQTGQPQTYEIKETYLGSMSPEAERTFTSTGRWSIQRGTSANPTVYRLDGGADAERARSFEWLSDQELRLLDRAGNRIESTLPYTLTRVADVTLTFGAPVTGSTAQPAPPSSATPGPAAMVTDLATGWPVTLNVGQDLTARLSSNRSTGFAWSLRKGSDGGVVQQQGGAAYEPAQTGASPGAASAEVFTLRAVKAGSATVTFDYKRPADDEPSKSVSYPVTVR